MGNIQSGINQFINQAAILGRLAPGFEERKENYKIGREQEVLRKELEQNIKGLKKSRVGEEEYKQLEKTSKRIDDLNERKFHNKPTQQNYENMLSDKKLTAKIKEVYSQLQNVRAQAKATQQVQQKMSFNDFKNQLTVKALPKPMQEKEYNEYTSKK